MRKLIPLTEQDMIDIAKAQVDKVGPEGEKGDKGDQGPAGNIGPQGPVGSQGPRGEKGPIGTSMPGEAGQKGLQGLSGASGEPGKDGADGDKGDTPNHRWKGTQLAFETPEGGMGKFVDLRGQPGQGGSSSGGSIVADILKLRDVNATGIVDGEALIFNAATGTFLPGTAGGSSSAIKCMTLENPLTNDFITWFFSDVQITVEQLNYIVSGGTSASVTTLFAPDRNILGATALVTAGNVVPTSISGVEVTTFDNAVIPAGSWIFMVITVATGTPSEFHATMKFTS
jgi:hypothetical protein